MTDVAIPEPAFKTQTARDHLRDALRNGGYGKLTEPRKLSDWALAASGLTFMAAVMIGLAAVMIGFGLAWWLAVPITVLAFVLFFVTTAVFDVAFLLMACVSPVVQTINVGWDVLLTHILPLLLAALATFLIDRFELVTVARTVRAIKDVITDLPYLFPAIALVMFAMILNTEIWQIGNRESLAGLGILCAVVIVPLTWLLRRELVRSIEKTFENVAVEVVKRDSVVDDVVEHVRRTAGRDAADWIRGNVEDEIKSGFHACDVKKTATAVCKDVSGTLKRRITTRLILTVLAVGVAAFVLIYGLTAMMVVEDVANSWLDVDKTDPDTTDGLRHLDLAGLALPLGPYVKVAAMLAILAVAVFIASVITTDSLAKFRNAYIEEPAETVLLLAVPYRALAPPGDDEPAVSFA